jgi:hypothetical protein
VDTTGLKLTENEIYEDFTHEDILALERKMKKHYPKTWTALTEILLQFEADIKARMEKIWRPLLIEYISLPDATEVHKEVAMDVLDVMNDSILITIVPANKNLVEEHEIHDIKVRCAYGAFRFVATLESSMFPEIENDPASVNRLCDAIQNSIRLSLV